MIKRLLFLPLMAAVLFSCENEQQPEAPVAQNPAGEISAAPQQSMQDSLPPDSFLPNPPPPPDLGSGPKGRSPGAENHRPISATASPQGAIEIIRSYYEAINTKRYKDAYEFWDNSGKASGQTYNEFVKSFNAMEHVEVVMGPPGRIEPAAGSRYISIPVNVMATVSGTRQTFNGTYILRRSEVDGADPRQQQWQLYKADIKKAQ